MPKTTPDNRETAYEDQMGWLEDRIVELNERLEVLEDTLYPAEGMDRKAIGERAIKVIWAARYGGGDDAR